VSARAQCTEGGGAGVWSTCVRMLTILLHYSTLCRDRRSSHLPPFRCRAPHPRMGGTLASRGDNTRHGRPR
jgi:hypothetical protein